VTVSIYSLSYLRSFDEKKTAGHPQALLHLLLASLIRGLHGSNRFLFSDCLGSDRPRGLLFGELQSPGGGPRPGRESFTFVCRMRVPVGLLAGFLLLSAQAEAWSFPALPPWAT